MQTYGWTDSRTDINTLIVIICNFANAPKNGLPTMKTVSTANKNQENGLFYTESHRTNLMDLGFIVLLLILSID